MERPPHRPSFPQAPLAHLAVCLSAGILVCYFLTLSLFLLTAFALLSSSILLVLILKQRLAPAAVIFYAAFFFTGGILGKLEPGDPAPNRLRALLDQGSIAVGDPVEVTGVTIGAVDYSWSRLYFTINVERLGYKGRDFAAAGKLALIASFKDKQQREEFERLELRHGARLCVMTTLRRSDSFRNPGVTRFTEFLDRKGFDATAFVKSSLLIERLDDEPVFLPLALLYKWRQKLQRQIDDQFSFQTAGVLDAALLGNRYNLTPQTSQRFREGGTFHVLVISGLHITFIGGVCLVVARRVTSRRGFQCVLCLTVLWAYTLAVGAEASVVRAALMFTVIALSPVFFRHASSLNSLGAAALMLLVWSPQNLFDPSFQLTFLSVFAIVALAWPLLKNLAAIGAWYPTRDHPYPPSVSTWLRSSSEAIFWSQKNWEKELAQSVYSCSLFKSRLGIVHERYRLQRLARYILVAFVVSVCVQIVLLPLQVVYFHRLSFASLVLNIFVGLLMVLLAFVSIVALLAAQVFAPVAPALTSIANGLTWLMVHSVDPFVQLDSASVRLPHYTDLAAAIYIIYYLPLAWLAAALHRWNPLQPPRLNRVNKTSVGLAGCQLLLALLIVLHPLSSGFVDGRLRVDFLDVGQGDSALVTMPDGTTLLIDGGGRPNFSGTVQMAGSDEEQFGHEIRSIGEAVVSEYLWWRGLDRVDYLLATHAHADHIDGLSDVAKNFRVRAVMVARLPAADTEFQKFARTLESRGIPLFLIGGGDRLRFDRIQANVLWPPVSRRVDAPSRNDDSVALRLEFGENSLLLTGDIEGSGEKAILATGQEIKADVVKVAHHGSRTSSLPQFVASSRPRIAIISVGQTSMFGHPSLEVVKRWESVGASVFTTGRFGTISVIFDGQKLHLETFVTPSRVQAP